MTTKEKMRRFQGYRWTSQMVENARRQERIDRIHANMTDCYATIRHIVDISQCWRATPQEHDYWSCIASEL